MAVAELGEVEFVLTAPSEADERARARRLLLAKARAYKIREGRGRSVHVHTTVEADARLLKRFYGGEYYSHQAAFSWQTARRAEVLKIKEEIFSSDNLDAKLRCACLNGFGDDEK